MQISCPADWDNYFLFRWSDEVTSDRRKFDNFIKLSREDEDLIFPLSYFNSAAGLVNDLIQEYNSEAENKSEN